ncbi:MAG: glycosyltransferase, partial [Acidimicrobiales bacterium]
MTEGLASAARAPAVVAVLVTTDPGPWFDETLEALAAQDYGSLSVLVLVSGGTSDPTEAVASRLPGAFVRRLPESGGFAAAIDEALWMVQGASFFLLCHDDCALAPDAVHLMVEESFRSNAGIVCPKMVHWDDPRTLLHVGQNTDKTGAVVDRVHDGEIDAGQHDAVRDVFVAPGGCTLVRTDLALEVGGYDLAAGSVGDDLDLS